MAITTNLLGRILGSLRSVHGVLYHIKNVITDAIPFAMGIFSGAAFVVYALAMWALDQLLAATVTVNNGFADAINQSTGVSSGSIMDILGTANFYFPMDTIGALSFLYVNLWVGVMGCKSAEKWAKTIDTFKSTVTK